MCIILGQWEFSTESLEQTNFHVIFLSDLNEKKRNKKKME